MTEKQKRFADEYIIDLNATRAYKAVYKSIKNDETAAQAGSRLLRNVKVKDCVKEKQKAIEKRTEITQDMVVKELAAIAFANGSDFAKVIEKNATDEYGAPIINQETGEPVKRKSVEVVLTDDLEVEKKKALAGIKYGKYGIEVSACDKTKALELLGRHLGMFTDKLQVEGVTAVQILDNVPRGDDNG
jgi:phage terminase small subunit